MKKLFLSLVLLGCTTAVFEMVYFAPQSDIQPVSTRSLVTTAPYLSLSEITPITTTLPVVTVTSERETEQSIEARFTGLLAHVRWLLAREEDGESRNTRSTLFDRQVERLADDQSDALRDLGESFDTSILTVGNSATVNGSLAVTGTTTLTALAADTIRLSSVTPTDTTNLLYNTGGVLYWAGNPVMGGGSGAWEDIGDDIYRLTGNVGIGTTTPAARLSVQGSGTSTGLLAQFSDNTSTPRMTILDNGNVGIGTTVPNFKLEVMGSQRLVGASSGGGLFLDAYRSDFTWNSGVIVFRRAGGTIESPTYVTSGQNLGYLTFRNHVRGNGATISAVATEDHTSLTSGTDFRFSVVQNGTNNPNEALRIAHNSNIGIGTTTPTSRLTVAGDIQVTGAFRDSSGDAGTNGQVLLSTLTGTDWVATSTLGIGASFSDSLGLANIISDETGTGALVFSDSPVFTGTLSAATANLSSTLSLSGAAANIALGSNFLSGDGDDEGLFVNAIGNVGIGTTTPRRQLTVTTSANDSAVVSIETPGTGGNQTVQIDLVTQSNANFLGVGNNRGWQITARGNNFSSAAQQNDLLFYYRDGSNWNEILGMDSVTGNVGIGTLVPTQRLTVAGNARITGALFDSTNTSGITGQILQSTGTGFQWVATSTLGFSSSFSNSAQLAALLSDETGTGSLVFANSPTLVTPNLGTPSALTLTNATGLPIATGVTGLATGIATFLTTPTSANLASTITDETGTGTLVFANSPTFTGTVNTAALTLSNNLTLSGTSSNIVLGANFLSGDGGDEGVFVDAIGNVGIGTSTPSSRLTIQGVAGNTNTFTVASSTGSTTLALLANGNLELPGQLISAGINWVTRIPVGNSNNRWSSVVYGNGLFVAVSFEGDRVMTSPDGIIWTIRSAAGNDDRWRDVTYGNGLFVAVGDSGDRVMTSPDGITWTTRSAAINDDSWNSITYGNGLFVAVGVEGDRVMTSPDGVTWTVRSAVGNDDRWQSVTYGNGLFVAVGDSGDRVITSPDGINWTARSAVGNNDSWQDIAYSNGLFVGVASFGDDRVITSPDGATWTTRSAAGNNDSWQSVTYGNGLFVVVADCNFFGGDCVMTSPDGITWTTRSAAGNDDNWNGITYGNGLFVAVGTIPNDRIMTSGFLDEVKLATNNLQQGGFSLFGNAQIGTTTLGTSGTNAQLSVQTNGTADILNLFRADGSRTLTVLESGNVGIGTTTPTSQLSVVGDVNFTGRLRNNGSQVLFVPGGNFTGTMIIGDGGGSLSHLGGDQGRFNTFVGLGVGTLTTTGNSNVGIGSSALASNAIGSNNVAIGRNALQVTTNSSANTAIGAFALQSNLNAGSNTAVGSFTLQLNTIGNSNTAVGASALAANVSGSSNTAIGSNALTVNTNSNNTAVGASALAANTSGTLNTAVGASALSTNITGQGNTAVGAQALLANTGNGNTALGALALTANVAGGSNTAVGRLALSANTSGFFNTAVGVNALSSNTGGSSNTAIGNNALQVNTATGNTALGASALAANTSGFGNTAVGNNALLTNITGQNNTAIGNNTLQANTGTGNTALGASALTANVAGGGNTAIGRLALTSNISGGSNTVIGNQALELNTTGNGNIAIGSSAGRNLVGGSSANQTGGNSIFIGNSTQALDDGQTNQIVIGSNAIGIGSNSVVLGNDSIVTTVLRGNVGIGTTTPTQLLTVAGNARITGALFDSTNTSGITGQILQSTGTGFQWVATSTLGFSSSFSNSAQLAALLSDETGTGSLVFANSPTFTGTLGVAAANLSSTLSFTGTAANIALGTNWLSGDGDDEGVFVDGNGNIGIGTTTVSSVFHILTQDPVLTIEDINSVAGNVRMGIDFELNNIDHGYIGFDQALTESNRNLVIANQRSAGDIAFLTSTGQQLRITSGGNVGIGTTTPTARLSVATSDVSLNPSANNAAVEVLNTAAGLGINSNILFSAANGAAINRYGAIGGVVTGQGALGTIGALSFYTKSFVTDTTLTERMRINSDGNVGIGTSTPGARLDLHTGGIRVFGDIITDSYTPSNTFLGALAASAHLTGVGNTAIGQSALQNGVAPQDNTAIGLGALFSSNGSNNTAIGVYSAYSTINGNFNTVVGNYSMYESVSGSGNTVIGYNTGRGIVSGINNTIVGSNVGGLSSTLSNNIIIADGSGNQRINVDSLGNVGIGDSTPLARLSVSDNTGLPLLVETNQTGQFEFRADGTPNFVLNSTDSNFINFQFQNNGAAQWYISKMQTTENLSFRNAGYSAILDVTQAGRVGIGTSTPSAVLTVSGTVRFATITGGTLQTDSLGNVTASSDERLKDIDGDYTAGLEAILGLTPIQYNWNEESGYDTETLYAGFSAQNVQEFLPAAVGQNPDGFLTLSDRPIIAALVNAVKEVWERLTGVERRVDTQEAELDYLRRRVEQLEATLGQPAPPPPAPASSEPVTPEEPETEPEPTPPVEG